MNNFENEYKKYSIESTPDLWSRIEAGIDAYEAEKANSSNENIISISDAPSKKKNGISRYAGIIAAAACVLIAVPAIILLGSESAKRLSATDSSSKYEKSSAAHSDNDAEYAEEAAEPAPEDYMADAAVMEAAEAPASASTFDNESEDSFKSADEDTSYCVKAMWDYEASPSSAEVIVIDDHIPDSKIRIFFTDNISDFKVLNITITDINEEGKLIYTSSTAYEGGSYNSGDELILELSFPGDIPNYAISYTDSNSNEHVLSVSESGYDGSIVLSEM